MSADLVVCLLPTDFLCILRSFWCSFLLCLHSTLYTKKTYFRAYISNLHVIRVLLDCSFPSEIPRNLIHSSLVVSLQAYVYRLDTLLPLLWSLLSTNTILSIFFLFLLAFLFKTFSAYTLAQTLYDICNSTSYVINFYCHSFWMASFWCSLQLPDRKSILHQKEFFLYTHR